MEECSNIIFGKESNATWALEPCDSLKSFLTFWQFESHFLIKFFSYMDEKCSTVQFGVCYGKSQFARLKNCKNFKNKHRQVVETA